MILKCGLLLAGNGSWDWDEIGMGWCGLGWDMDLNGMCDLGRDWERVGRDSDDNLNNFVGLDYDVRIRRTEVLSCFNYNCLGQTAWNPYQVKYSGP